MLGGQRPVVSGCMEDEGTHLEEDDCEQRRLVEIEEEQME